MYIVIGVRHTCQCDARFLAVTGVVFRGCYNENVNRPAHAIQTSGDADLAFAVVVLASYFTTFSTLQHASINALLFLIGLGVAYITVGIYGYGLVAKSKRFSLTLVYFAIQATLGGLIVRIGHGSTFNAMALLPLAGQTVMLLDREWRAGINGLLVLVYIGATGLFAAGWQEVWSGLPLFLGGQIFIIVFTQMAVNEEHARTEMELMTRDLTEANHNLRAYAVQVEELAITKERNRMAREIHDGLGHYLTTIYMQIQAVRAVMKTDEEKAQEMLLKAQNQAQEALAEVRSSVATLRDAPGSSLSLAEEIERIFVSCEMAGITADLKVIGSARPLSPQVHWTLYRAVQEGANNTHKHAHACHFNVIVDYSQADHVRLMMQDDGLGAVKTEGGFGLIGMRERVHLLNGAMQIQTAPGAGFQIEMILPG